MHQRTKAVTAECSHVAIFSTQRARMEEERKHAITHVIFDLDGLLIGELQLVRAGVHGVNINTCVCVRWSGAYSHVARVPLCSTDSIPRMARCW